MRYSRQYNKRPKPLKRKYFDPTRRITLEAIATVHLVPRPISLRACREPVPRAEHAKRTAAIARAMGRMSDKVVGDEDRFEHSKTCGSGY